MKINSLRFKTENGESLCNSFNLIKDHGIEGDKKAKGGERQVCLADEGYLSQYRLQNKGLCVKRFMPNISTQGLDYSCLKPGEKLSIGNAIIEISSCKKKCFEECPFVIDGKTCDIKNNCAFGMIINSGTIHIDEEIKKL